MATKKTTKSTPKPTTKYVARWNKRINGKVTSITAIVTKRGTTYVDENGMAVPEWADIKPVS